MKAITSKKAVEWYILVTLIMLVFSIVLILAYYMGAFPKVESAVDTNSIPYGFICDNLVIATSQWHNFLGDTDVKNMLYRVPAKPGDTVAMTVGPGRIEYGNMKVVKTPFLTASYALVMDSRKAAMLVKESDLETFEGAIVGRPYDREIVALMSYALAVIYPYAVCKITA